MRGKATDLQASPAAQLETAAETIAFERAVSLRDRIRAIAHVRAQQDINPDGIEEADIFSIAIEGGLSAVQVFFIRAGQNWGATIHFPRHEKGEDEADIKNHMISVGSPISRALIGKEEGEVVIVKAPGGDIEYEIDQVQHI